MVSRQVRRILYSDRGVLSAVVQRSTGSTERPLTRTTVRWRHREELSSMSYAVPAVRVIELIILTREAS
jgi:hypothetical protein